MRALMLEARLRGGDAFGDALAAALARRAITLDRVGTRLHLDSALARATTQGAVLMADGQDAEPARALLRTLREQHPALAVMVVVVGITAAERSAWLDGGADDCLALPADSDEAAARLAAAMRLSVRAAQPRDRRHGPLLLHADRRGASWRGRSVMLTPREYSLLEVFVDRAGRLLPRETLHEALHGDDNDIAGNTVEVYVHALRRKLHKQMIRTVRGAGYRLADAAALGDG
jgi:DNA-binding response OmpR family regulator